MLLHQLRDAQRALRRSLPVSLTIVMCLGFGMGSVTVVYSWYQGLIQHPLPAVTQTDDLVTVRSRATTGATLTALPEYRDWREQGQSLSDLAASSLHLFGVSMTGDAGGLSEPVFGVFASSNYFRVLRLAIPIGRDFEASADTVDAEGFAVIVSHRLWTGRLRARPDIVGQPIRINGRLGTIVGVAPPLFGGTLAGASFDLWVPLSARALLVPPEAELVESRSLLWLDVVGRLRPGVTISQVREEFAAVGRRSAETHAESRGRTIEVVPLDTGTVQQLRPLFVSLLVLSAVVLLIVCSNVTNLLLVRGTSRVREITIRLALGATRAHVLGQLMLENTILAIAGAALALTLTIASRAGLVGLTPTTALPLNLDTPLDFRVLAFLVALTSATVLLFGLVPALLTSRLQITEALGGTARAATVGRSRTRAVLVALQFALCLTTLVTGTLFLRRAIAADAAASGFVDPSRVLLIQTESSFAGYGELRRWQTTLDTIASRVREVPGVRSATWSTFVPLGFVGYSRRHVAVDSYTPRTGESMRILVSGVGAGYFDLMRIPILEGRSIDAGDSPGRSHVAVVNEAFARRFWGASPGVGRHITLDDRVLTVVGIAKNGRYDYRLFDQPPEPVIYYALGQWPHRFAILHARTDSNALAAAPAVRQAISEVDPTFATLAPTSLQDYVAAPMTPLRVGLALLGILGLAALALSAMGIQAIVAYGVAIRTREIGIRLTLGASPRRVMSIFLRQTLMMTGAGIVAGLACAAVVVPVLQQRVGYLGSVDFAATIGPVALLTSVGIAAGYGAAWRATRVDPAETLRAE